MATKLLLPLLDYQRIFRVIYSAIDERSHSGRACIFFALVGAAILRKHYKLNATPLVGAAAIVVNANNSSALTFGQINQDKLICSPEAFHCWVECDGFAIDFMAPIFQESMRSSGHNTVVPRRMFQSRLEHMAPALGDFTHEGAFILLPDAQLTISTINNFGARHMNTDFANICLEWYKRPPKRISETLDIRDEHGEVTTLKLHGPAIDGVW
jgi:hypothetical protein